MEDEIIVLGECADTLAALGDGCCEGGGAQVVYQVGPQGPPGPPGPAGGVASTITGETPTGAINGANAAFQSQFDFVPETVEVFLNGLQLRRVTDFNTTGTRDIQLTDSPGVGESVRINYFRS